MVCYGMIPLMPVIRNQLSAARAGGPRQFAEIRNEFLVQANNFDDLDNVKSELNELGLSFEELNNIPVLTVRPRDKIEDVIDNVSAAGSDIREGVRDIQEAREQAENVIESTLATIEATGAVLRELDSLQEVINAEFVRTEADFGPQNLRMDITKTPDVGLNEAQDAEGNLGSMYNSEGITDAWTQTRGENAIACIFDTAFSEDLIASDRIVDTFSGESVSTVFDSSEGHGTMCAGAMTANSSEDVPFSGVAPEAGVILVRVTDDQGQIKTSTISKAWDWLIDLDVDRPIVANHSYGTPLCSGRPKQRFCGTSVNDVISVATSSPQITAVYAAGNEANRCFPPGTKITTTDGHKNIENVEIGDHVLTNTGALKKVTETLTNQKSFDTNVKIDPWYGQSIECTKDHPIYVYSQFEGEFMWKEANDVTENDYVAMPKAQEYNDAVPSTLELEDYVMTEQRRKYKRVMELRGELETDIYKCPKCGDEFGSGSALGGHVANTSKHGSLDEDEKYQQGNSANVISEHVDVPLGTIHEWLNYDTTPGFGGESDDIPEEVDVGLDLARLIGYYVADGHASDNSIQFSMHEDEAEMERDITELMRDIFNIYPDDIRSTEGKGQAIQYSCRPVSDLFKDLCNHGAENKKFPDWGLYADKHIVEEMVRGYYKGDGNHDGADRYSASTQSEELAMQYKLMMARLNIPVSHYTSEGGDESEIYGRTVSRNSERHRLVTSTKEKFEEKMKDLTGVQLGKERKQKQIKEAKVHAAQDHLLMKVKNVGKKIYSGTVYNLEVEDDHTYVANGIAVHNCGHRPSGLTNAITGTNSIQEVITVGALLTNGREAQTYSSHGRGDCAPIADPKPNVCFPIPKVTYYGADDGWKLKDLSTGPFGSGGGTSHASPTIAGLVTLLQSKAVSEGRGEGRTATRGEQGAMQTEEIKQILHETAVLPHQNQINSFSLLFSEEGYDARFGHGKAKPVRALNQV